MIADRRRRLLAQMDAQAQLHTDRRLSGHHTTPRLIHTPTQPLGEVILPGHNNSSRSSVPPNPLERSLSRRSTDRPFPERRSQEIKLPKWQADEEISRCPICRTTFTFWYRKHHCRKCGRVVCANCSPHRITIPRQFIVHPPETASSLIESRNHRAFEVVDLTDDDNADRDDQPSIDQRPRSSDYRIDSALGGGQEVRLCNPCVPDPNPLPHIPSRPLNSAQVHSPSSSQLMLEGNLGSRRWQPFDSPLPAASNRTLSDRQEGFPSSTSNTAFDDGLVSLAPTSSRRYSHIPQSSATPMPPSSLPALHGSARNSLDQHVGHCSLFFVDIASNQL